MCISGLANFYPFPLVQIAPLKPAFVLDLFILGKDISYMAVCQNLVPLVNIKIAGKWMFIPLKMVLIGIDPYPYIHDIAWLHLHATQLGRPNP